MAYERIEDFPEIGSLSSPELAALANVWKERRSELERNEAYQDFINKMQREWAIETGIIERLYTWDRGVTEILIEQGIESSLISHQGGVSQGEAEHIRAIISDQLDIVDGLFAYIKGEEPMTESFIRGLQAKFTLHQDTTEALTPDGRRISVAMRRGEYKTQPNNPRRPDGAIHPYCPPELTKEEMERLVTLYRNANGRYSTEVRAAWLHHRFTQIHPFQDGNGRVARALASLVFIKGGLFPLVIRESDRIEYITALETADSGDLGPLTRLFARRQRDAILRVFGLERQVPRAQDADQIIKSALQVLMDREKREAGTLGQVQKFADRVEHVARERLDAVAGELDRGLGQIQQGRIPHYSARTSSSEPATEHCFYQQIVVTAKQLGYHANLDLRRHWISLCITTSQRFEYVLSVHGYGSGDSGILAVTAFTDVRAPSEEGSREPVNLRPAAPDLFQFNYAEPIESIENRFKEWLESSLAMALAEWQRSIQ